MGIAWMLSVVALAGFQVWDDLHGASHAGVETSDVVLGESPSRDTQFYPEGISHDLI